jgi:hypothetical protein
VYLLYGFEEARLVFFGLSKNVVAYVAGDDVMIKGKVGYINGLHKMLFVTHAHDVDVGALGLG